MNSIYELKNAIVKFGVTDELSWNEVEKVVDKVCKRESDKFQKSLSLLRDLADLQNGSPLATYETQWNETMNEIYTFLKEHEQD